MSDPESEQIIRTAREAVQRGYSRLKADMDSLHEQHQHGTLRPYPYKDGQAVLNAVVGEVDAHVGPILDAWGALAAHHPGTHIEFGYRRFRDIPRLMADRFTPTTAELVESALRRAASDLDGAVYYLRREPDDADSGEPPLQVPLVDDPVQAIREACDALGRAWGKVLDIQGSLNESGLGQAEQLEMGQARLNGVLAELDANLRPVISTWTKLADRRPILLAHDPESERLGVALHMYRDAEKEAAAPFTQHTIGLVEQLLHDAAGYLTVSGYYSRPEPAEPEGPRYPIGSRPPGPDFLDDDDVDTYGSSLLDRRDSVGSIPPGPSFLDDDELWRDASPPALVSDVSAALEPPDVIEQVLPQTETSASADVDASPMSPRPQYHSADTAPPGPPGPPGPSSTRAGSDSEVPGPYDDLREPWLRRLLRRDRDRRRGS